LSAPEFQPEENTKDYWDVEYDRGQTKKVKHKWNDEQDDGPRVNFFQQLAEKQTVDYPHSTPLTSTPFLSSNFPVLLHRNTRRLVTFRIMIEGEAVVAEEGEEGEAEVEEGEGEEGGVAEEDEGEVEEEGEGEGLGFKNH